MALNFSLSFGLLKMRRPARKKPHNCSQRVGGGLGKGGPTVTSTQSQTAPDRAVAVSRTLPGVRPRSLNSQVTLSRTEFSGSSKYATAGFDSWISRYTPSDSQQPQSP